MNFEESKAYLYSLGNEVEAMKLGLENIETLLDALGNPQNDYVKVQVAGTNGKGSVCAFLDSICRSAEIEVGLYTSPHLISITERVKINGTDISEDEFAKLATLVRVTAETLLSEGKLQYTPTFFEQMTTIALLAFSSAKVELAILETGLGGRLDAVTAAKAQIAVITRIDYDHHEYLGETIEEIAAEKAAIIRSDTAAIVIGGQDPAALSVIRERTTVIANNQQIVMDTNATTSSEFRIGSESIGLRGAHQVENARVAVAAVEALRQHFPISDRDLLEGLERANHPGRLEYIGPFLLDGAHNAGAAKAIAAYLREMDARPITIMFGAMRDKDLSAIASILFPFAERLVLTQPGNSRSLSYSELLEALPTSYSRLAVFATDTVHKGIEIGRAITPDGGVILITGSLYLVGEARQMLMAEPVI